jgi:hypothetical protein
MQSAQTAAPQFSPSVLKQRNADEAAFGAGSGTIYDPWEQGAMYMGSRTRDASGNLYPGYGNSGPTQQTAKDFSGNPVTYSRPSQDFQWDNATNPNGTPNPNAGPGPNFTKAGRANLDAGITATANNQTFPGLQSLLDYMAVSTPGSQAIKTQMENRDPQGGPRDPGEAPLFDTFAKYLGQNVAQPPGGATPFTDWNPTGLLALLRSAGIVR